MSVCVGMYSVWGGGTRNLKGVHVCVYVWGGEGGRGRGREGGGGGEGEELHGYVPSNLPKYIVGSLTCEPSKNSHYGVE